MLGLLTRTRGTLDAICSMTWKYMMLIVLLNTLDLSKAGCANYFNIDEWPSIQITLTNLTQTIPVVKGATLYDSMKCTLEKEKSKRDVQHFLIDCFTRGGHNMENTSCESDIIDDVPFYHFMCLMALAVNEIPRGCDYGTMWKILSTYGQTTTSPPPTTTPPPTTPTESATTELLSPSTTKTATTSVTLSLSASSPMASSSASLPTTSATTAVTQTAHNTSDEQSQLDKQTDRTTDCAFHRNMTIFLAVSLVILVLGMCFLYSYLQHRRHRESDIESNPNITMNSTFVEGPAEEEPITSGPDAYEAEQWSRSIQHPAVVPCSVDTNPEERHLMNGQMAFSSCSV